MVVVPVTAVPDTVPLVAVDVLIAFRCRLRVVVAAVVVVVVAVLDVSVTDVALVPVAVVDVCV